MALVPQSAVYAQPVPVPADQDENSPTLDCEILDSNPLNWVGCPLVTGLQASVNALNAAIDAMLTVNVDTLFSNEYKTAWSSFRALAIGIIIIGGLVMLASQAIGLEIIDAYNFKKVMPRLIIAVIFTAISWELLRFLVTLSNDAGNSVRAIIYQPFQGISGPLGDALRVGNSGKIVSTLISLAGLFVLGLPAILSFVATAALAVGIAFLILLVRQMVIIFLVMISPFAIACYVLPNTQKVFDFWKSALLSMLVVFPIISGMIAIGRVFAVVAYGNTSGGAIPLIQQVTAFIAFFLPYLLLPFAFRLAGGAIGTIAGIANDRGKGAFDRLSGFRGNKMSERYNNAKTGQGGYLGANAAGAVYRRATLGGNPLTRRGRARYRGKVTALTQNSADEILKRDNGRMANDDDANALALQQGMSRGQFIREYQARTGGSATDARDALGELESSYGATLGSGAMRTAAFKARAASVTGYVPDMSIADPDERDRAMRALMMQDASSLVDSGLMSQADAISSFKANKARADINGPGFGAQMNQLGTSLARYRNGARGNALISTDEATALSTDALMGGQPGALLGARRETVRMLAPRMVANLQTAQTRATAIEAAERAAVGTGPLTAAAQGRIDEANRAVSRQLASVAGRYDAMAQISPQNAEVMAEVVMGQNLNLGGNVLTVRDHIEQRRTADPDFLGMRREYASATAAAGAGSVPPPGGPPPGGSTIPSDRRLKREIRYLGKTNTHIKLYRFKYLWSSQEYVGVMAQDLIHSHPEALQKDSYGFYSVDYDVLGIKMYTIEEWHLESKKAAVVVS